MESFGRRQIRESEERPLMHKDSDHIADTSLLFSGTTIDGAEDILETLYKVERVIWDLYTNGHKMNFGYWELK